MAQIDLKPLSKDTINKMGWTNHDLWMVKIGAEIYGPFETESLKQYSAENEDQFDEATTTRVENNDFKPFWSFSLFQRKSPRETVAETPYWIMDQGQKAGPLSFREIDKKIELGTLASRDQISKDDGHTWHRISEIEEFEGRTHSAEKLPAVPDEPSFRKAKLAVAAKIEEVHTNAPDVIANLAYLGQQKEKTRTVVLEDLTLQNLNSEPEVSQSLKWAIPAGLMVVIALGSTGYYIFSPSTSEVAYVAETENPEPKKVVMPPKTETTAVESQRRPASTPPAYIPPKSYPEEPRYRTYTESHMNELPEDRERDRERDKVEKDPRDVHTADAPHSEEPVEEKEHSLVQGTPTNEEQSLDAAMNSDQPPAEPVVEEASDF